jgi:drug/metabolite transporter (DMT)-like permease
VTGTALAIVLLAAVLHAVWNAMIKASGDRAVSLGLIALGHTLLGGVATLFVPLPSAAAFVFILASTVVHCLYYLLIFHAYRLGDLSLVYPIGRGSAPVLVTLGAFLALGETIPAGGWAGVFAVSCGVLLVTWRGGRHAPPRSLEASSRPAILLALATGATIASYSVIDGVGARTAGDTATYVAWLFLFEGVIFAWFLATRPLDFATLRARSWAIGLAGGFISAAAYGLAIHAKTIAPIGLVSALRETSVIFAAGIGVVLLGERPWQPRLLAAAVVAAGIVLIALA